MNKTLCYNCHFTHFYPSYCFKNLKCIKRKKLLATVLRGTLMEMGDLNGNKDSIDLF